MKREANALGDVSFLHLQPLLGRRALCVVQQSLDIEAAALEFTARLVRQKLRQKLQGSNGQTQFLNADAVDILLDNDVAHRKTVLCCCGPGRAQDRAVLS